MERLKKIGAIFSLIIIFGCSNAYKYNREINRLDKSINEKHLEVNKNALKFIGKQLNKTKHIYYKVSPFYSYNGVFERWTIVVFDEDNNIVYNLNSNDKNEISLKNTYDFKDITHLKDTIYVKNEIDLNNKSYLTKYFKDTIYITDMFHAKDHNFDIENDFFVYNLFKNGTCDTLQKFKEYNNSSEIILETIYEINLETKKNRVCTYEEIFYFVLLYDEIHGF